MWETKMTDALAKVARGIGMVPASDDPTDKWTDSVVGRVIPVRVGDALSLRTYLLTGDRPMRIMERWRMAVDVHPAAADAVWCAISDRGAFGATPAEAILACAEAVCS